MREPHATTAAVDLKVWLGHSEESRLIAGCVIICIPNEENTIIRHTAGSHWLFRWS